MSDIYLYDARRHLAETARQYRADQRRGYVADRRIITERRSAVRSLSRARRSTTERRTTTTTNPETSIR